MSPAAPSRPPWQRPCATDVYLVHVFACALRRVFRHAASLSAVSADASWCIKSSCAWLTSCRMRTESSASSCACGMRRYVYRHVCREQRLVVRLATQRPNIRSNIRSTSLRADLVGRKGGGKFQEAMISISNSILTVGLCSQASCASAERFDEAITTITAAACPPKKYGHTEHSVGRSMGACREHLAGHSTEHFSCLPEEPAEAESAFLGWRNTHTRREVEDGFHQPPIRERQHVGKVEPGLGALTLKRNIRRNIRWNIRWNVAIEGASESGLRIETCSRTARVTTSSMMRRAVPGGSCCFCAAMTRRRACA